MKSNQYIYKVKWASWIFVWAIEVKLSVVLSAATALSICDWGGMTRLMLHFFTSSVSFWKRVFFSGYWHLTLSWKKERCCTPISDAAVFFAIRTTLCVMIWENLTRFLSDPLDWVKSPVLLLCHFYLLERWAACYFHHFPGVELCVPGSWWSAASAPQQLLLHGGKCVDSWPTFSTVRVKTDTMQGKIYVKGFSRVASYFYLLVKKSQHLGGICDTCSIFTQYCKWILRRYYMSQHNEP